MTERSEEISALITLENGKSISDARSEVAYAAEFFRWYSEEAVRIIGDISASPSGRNKILVQYKPIGVSVLVTPWNFPAAMATRKIAPALAAGCTCVLKPAAETPLTALAIADLLLEAGVPPGVLNVLTTSQPDEVVGALLSDFRVRKLSFTGSTRIGKLLLRRASERVVSCSMELGGNAPFIVFDDANLTEAVSGAMIAKMRNGGQACTAANRFYVHEAIADKFASKLADKIKQLKVGEGTDADCGPLITNVARQRISRLVQDATMKGAEVLTGGSVLPREGYFFQPTVLTGVPKDALILGEEIFGPVVPIVSFSTEQEAVKFANETEYGLVAYVFTQDLGRGLRVGEQIEAGMVALNKGLVSDPAAPFGGCKQSGLGREGAHIGLHEYLEAQYTALSW